MSVPCIVYRFRRRTDTYLYVHADYGLARVPAELVARLGGVDMVLEIELEPGRKLARIAAIDLMREIERDGFFLQLPRQDAVEAENPVASDGK